jgi:hypothetical protein
MIMTLPIILSSYLIVLIVLIHILYLHSRSGFGGRSFGRNTSLGNHLFNESGIDSLVVLILLGTSISIKLFI